MGTFTFKGTVCSFKVSDDGKELIVWYPDDIPDGVSKAFFEIHQFHKDVQTQYAVAVRLAAGKPPVVPAAVTAKPIAAPSDASEQAPSDESAQSPSDVATIAPPEELAGETPAVAAPVGPPRLQPRPPRKEVSQIPHGRGVVTRDVIGEDGALAERAVVEEVSGQGSKMIDPPQGGQAAQTSLRQQPSRSSGSMSRRPIGNPPQVGMPNINRQHGPTRSTNGARQGQPQPVRPIFTKSFDRMTKGK